jgi:hypothetical protein
MICFIILVIIGAMGIVTEGLKHLETRPKNHSIDSVQKAAVVGISHIRRKVLQSET